jgi:hypothetical protein
MMVAQHPTFEFSLDVGPHWRRPRFEAAHTD